MQKTPLMASMLMVIGVLMKGTLPDLVMKSEKNLQITCSVKKLEKVEIFANTINNLAQRIVSLKIDEEIEDQEEEGIED